MTMIPAKVVIANLRAKIQKLKDKIKAVKERIAQYEKLVTLPDPADLSLIEDIKKLLEAEGDGD